MDTGEQDSVIDRVPLALSMIVCDAVHTDPSTGKAYILGCFGSIGASNFPAMHPGMTVFAEVADCLGKTPFLIRVIDANEDHEPIVEANAEIEIADPLAITALVLRLEGMVFPEAGEYRVQLFSGNALIAERRLLLSSNPEETHT